jgi:hypothetical protein
MLKRGKNDARAGKMMMARQKNDVAAQEEVAVG